MKKLLPVAAIWMIALLGCKKDTGPDARGTSGLTAAEAYQLLGGYWVTSDSISTSYFNTDGNTIIAANVKVKAPYLWIHTVLSATGNSTYFLQTSNYHAINPSVAGQTNTFQLSVHDRTTDILDQNSSALLYKLQYLDSAHLVISTTRVTPLTYQINGTTQTAASAGQVYNYRRYTP